MKNESRVIEDGVQRTCSVKRCTGDAYYWAEFKNQDFPVCPEHSSEVGKKDTSSKSDEMDKE